MKEKPFLEGYGGQTTDELLAMATKYRVDSIVLAFEAGIQLAEETRAISRDESCVLAVCALDREVNNGGYNQFFFNSSNEYTTTIIDALRAIGCPETANITQDAISALGIEGELTTDAVQDAAADEDEELEEVLSSCDNRFYAYVEPIEDRLFEWIGQNRRSIQLSIPR